MPMAPPASSLATVTLWNGVRTPSGGGRVNRRAVIREPPSHAHDVVHDISDTAVELGRRLVRRADLQVHLHAPEIAQPPFRLLHEHLAQPPPLVVRMDREVVDPAPV